MLQNLEWNGVLKRLIQGTTLQDCNTCKFKLLSRFALTLWFEGSVQSDFITVEECGMQWRIWDYWKGVSEVIFGGAMPTSGTNPTPLGGNPNPPHVV